MKNIYLLCLLFIFSVLSKAQSTSVSITANSGSGTNAPFNTTVTGNANNMGVCEVVYTAREIGFAYGRIDSLAFFAVGSSGQTMNGVSIYMKHVPDTQLVQGIWNLDGYVRVFNGNFNVSNSGWNRVALSTPFYYDSTRIEKNLSLLIVRNAGSISSLTTFMTSAASGKVRLGNGNISILYENSTDSMNGFLATGSDRPAIRFRAQLLPACNSAQAGTGLFAGFACQGSAVILKCENSGVGSGISYQWEESNNNSSWSVCTSGSNVSSPVYTTSTSPSKFYRLSVTCFNNGQTSYSNSIDLSKFIRNSQITAFTYTEGFDSIDFNQNLPCGWTCFADSGTLDTCGIFRRRLPAGIGSVGFQTSAPWSLSVNTPNKIVYIVSAPIQLKANFSYKITVNYRALNNLKTEKFDLRFATANSAATLRAATPFCSNNYCNNTAFNQISGVFKAAAAGNYYLAIKTYSDSLGQGMIFDDVSVEEFPACTGLPSGGSLPSGMNVCYGNKLILAPSGVTVGSGIIYQWEQSSNGSAWSNVTGGNSISLSTPAIVSNIYYRLKVTCTPSSQFSYSGTILLSVLSSSSVTVPNSENFENVSGVVPFLPCGWISSNNYIGWEGQINSANAYLAAGKTSGNFVRLLTNQPSNGSEYLFSNGVQLDSGKNYQVKFYYRTQNGASENIQVIWTNAQTNNALNAGTSVFNLNTNSVSYTLGSTGVFKPAATNVYYLAFVGLTGSNRGGIYIDSITIDSVKGNDFAVKNIYTLSRVPNYIGMQDTIKARISNVGLNFLTRTIYLKVSGKQQFIDSVSLAMAPGTSSIVSFTSAAALNRNLVGTDTLLVYTAPDDNQSNDTLSAIQEITLNIYNYGNMNQTASGGIGISGGSGDIVARYYVNGSNNVNQVKLYLTGNSGNYSVVVYDATGVNGAPGNLIWRSRTYNSSSGVNVVNVVDSASGLSVNAGVAGYFYVGVRQMSSASIGLGYQDELPLRSAVFYSKNLNASNWTDFGAGSVSFKLMIEPRLKMAYDLGVAALAQPTCVISGSQSVTFQIKNYGAFNYNFSATDSLLIYSYAIAPNGSVTNFSPVKISSGSISSNATNNINVSGNYIMNQSGNYLFNAYTAASLDLNSDNDSMPVSVAKYVGILNQPSSASLCNNSSTQFSVTAQGSSLSYQWYYGTGGSFALVSNGAVFSGATTATLNLTNPPVSLSGYAFFCTVTNACLSPVNTDTVSLNVYQASNPGIAAISKQYVCPSQSVNLYLSNYNGQIQWQQNSGSGWTNFGVASDTLLNVPVSVTTQFRAKVKNAICADTFTNILNVSSGGSYNIWSGGGTNNNWRNKQNWCLGYVPGYSTSAVLNANVVIDAAAGCNNLIINAGDTLFITSGGNLTINGDLTINGALVMTAGTITFTKAGTCIPSATYHQLRVCAAGTVYACGNMTVNNNLIICNGTTFNDTGYTITVKANIDNNGTHVSQNSGKLNLNSSAFTYTLTGTGTYGNIDLTANGLRLGTTGLISIPVTANTTVTGTLNMNQGSISLNNSVLTIGSAGSASGQLNNAGNGLILGASGSGLILLGSSGSSAISNVRLSNVENVTINRPNGVSLGASSNITGALSLVSGKLNQNGYHLIIGNTGMATGAVSYTSGYLSNSASSGYLYLNGNSSSGLYTLKADTLNGYGMFSPSGVALMGNVYIRTGATLSSGDMNLNGNTMTLSSTAFISETAGQNFKGNGTIRTTRNFSTALNNNNIAGMGLLLSTGSATGTTTIVRGHVVQTNSGKSSIARYYDVTVQNAVTATKMELNYDSTELNGNVRGRLRINTTTNGGATWSSITGCSPTVVNSATGMVGKYTGVSLSGSARYTASDSLNSLSPVFENTTVESHENINGKISTWPNPFNSSFTAELDVAAGNYQVTLMDMNGRVIESKQVEVQTGKVQLNVSGEGLSSGVYLLNIQGNGSTTNLKVVKQ